MNSPFQNDQDIIDSINLTNQLETSLKKILTNKKKTQCAPHTCIDRREHNRIIEELDTLKAEKEVLVNDNQLLSKELLSCKMQIRELSKEVRQLKKYIDFLQGYNSALKKEMAFWVKRPRPQATVEASEPDYQALSHEIEQLKRMNCLREKELFQADTGNTVVVRGSKYLQCAKSASASKKTTKHSINLTRNQSEACSCTKMPRSGKMVKNKSFAGKSKKLCSCHKSYLETSDFIY